MRAGILPDVVVSVDAHEQGPRRLLDLPTASLSSCTLVYSPVVAHEALTAWPGPRLAAPPGRLYSSGSVIPMIPNLFLSRRVLARLTRRTALFFQNALT